MKYAKAMRLVPDDVYQRLINGNLPPTVTDPHPAKLAEQFPHYGHVHGDELYNFSAVLNNTQLGDDEKWKLYQQKMHRSLDKQEILEKTKPAVKVQLAGEDGKVVTFADQQQRDGKKTHPHREPVLSSFSKPQQAKAQIVVDELKRTSGLTWDDVGSVRINGTDLQGANIADLVTYMITARQKVPPGWEEFGDHLHEQNFPKKNITNVAARKYVSDPIGYIGATPPTGIRPSLRSKNLRSAFTTPRVTRGKASKVKDAVAEKTVHVGQGFSQGGRGNGSIKKKGRGGRRNTKTAKCGRKSKCSTWRALV
jgi:hypothetical protein